MRLGLSGRLPVVVLALALAGGLFGQASAADGAATDARTKAMRETLERLNAQLKAHGGTWERWAEGLKDFREDLKAAQTGKWPWPARDKFVFYGASFQVMLLNDLEDLPEGSRPFEPIVALDRQLKKRGIDLILALIPSKLNVYPDYLWVKEGQGVRAPQDRDVNPAVKRLMQRLLENDVEVVDLYTTFAEARRELEGQAQLYYTNDGHWKNVGARIAAEKIAERLKRYDFVQAALAKGNPYTVTPRSRSDGVKADADVHGIVTAATGAKYGDVGNSPVILTGDSFSMYNPPDAHITAQVARHIGLPLTLIAKEGLSFEVPVRLAELEKQNGYLRNRRVVVWTFNDCMFMLKPPNKWPKVELPEASGARPATPAAPAKGAVEAPADGVPATGIVGEVSGAPRSDRPYAHYFLLAYVKDLKDAAGKPIGGGDAVVHVLAMHQRRLLPAAKIKEGDRLEMRLIPWANVEKTHDRVQSGLLPTVALSIEKPHYLSLLPGAPRLTEEDLSKVGEEVRTP